MFKKKKKEKNAAACWRFKVGSPYSSLSAVAVGCSALSWE
jgi:hypothetical protein